MSKNIYLIVKIKNDFIPTKFFYVHFFSVSEKSILPKPDKLKF